MYTIYIYYLLHTEKCRYPRTEPLEDTNNGYILSVSHSGKYGGAKDEIGHVWATQNQHVNIISNVIMQHSDKPGHWAHWQNVTMTSPICIWLLPHFSQKSIKICIFSFTFFQFWYEHMWEFENPFHKKCVLAWQIIGKSCSSLRWYFSKRYSAKKSTAAKI